MKNLKLIFFFGVMLIVSTPMYSQTSTTLSSIQTERPSGVTGSSVQEATPTDQPTATKTNFFQNIWNNAKESGVWVVVMYVLGILSKNGVTKIVKAVAGKTTIVTKELSDVSLAVSNFSSLVDKAIAADGSVDQSSLKEAAEAGKTVVAETKEAWITIKPKPVGTPAV